MAPPVCNLGRKFEHKNGQNLTNESFFFWSLPNFGQKNELILTGKIFLLVFIILKFPGLLPSENPAYASVEDNRSRIALKILIKHENRQINF